MRKRRLGKDEKREVTPEFVNMSKEILYPQIQGVTAVLVVKAAATVGTVGEAVVTCGHEVPHGTGVAKSREIPTDAGIVIFLGPGGPVGQGVRQPVPR